MNAINTNLSYFRLRKIIGYLGVSLPVTTPLFAWEYLASISHAYYTTSTVLFTSTLTLTGVFLMSYRGYGKVDEKISDNVITWIAGVLVTVVAFVPTKLKETCTSGDCVMPVCHCDDLWGWVHFGSAVLFFIAMAYLFIVRFTKGDLNPKKIFRNKIYRFCGWVMMVVLILAGLKIWLFEELWEAHFVFWAEVVLLVFFGTAWLVKGKALVDFKIQKDDPKLSQEEAEQIAQNIVLQLTSVEEGRALIKKMEESK